MEKSQHEEEQEREKGETMSASEVINLEVFWYLGFF